MIDFPIVTGWQDPAISVGLVIFIASVAGMVIDEQTVVSPTKAVAYTTGQLIVAITNASLGLWMSATLLLVGSSLWLAVGYQGYMSQRMTPSIT